MLIKDLETGRVREYGKDCHDSLAISPEGRSLSYYNLQCGEGSRYGCFRFVMEDGEVPAASQTPDATHAECYFNIGGFHALEEAVEILQEIREAVWDRDIPSSTCPEYVEHHNDCLEIISLIDSKIRQIKGEE